MKIGSIVINCYEFDRMLAFWQQALLDVPREPAKGGWVVLRNPEGRGPNISLKQVQEKRSGKRSRLHLDLYASNRGAEVERLLRVGATRCPWRYGPNSDFVVLADPDDNLFCVVSRAPKPDRSWAQSTRALKQPPAMAMATRRKPSDVRIEPRKTAPCLMLSATIRSRLAPGAADRVR